MPIDIDGYAVLGAIARKPELFPSIKNDVSKIGRSLVVKQIKERKLSLNELQLIARLVGQETLSMILDPLADKDIGSLLKKIDGHNVDVRIAPTEEQRRRVTDLIEGSAQPATKKVQGKEPKPKAPPKPKVERALNSKAMRAVKK